MRIKITSLFNKLSKSLEEKKPFVVYKYPRAKEVKGIFQKNKIIYKTHNFSESGFVFAPFDSSSEAIIFPLEKSNLYSSEYLELGNTSKNSSFFSSKPSEEEKNHHIDLVRKGVRFLKNTQAKKVVLSRKQVVDYSSIDVFFFYKKLIKNYPNAMVYIWFHPKVGLWLGATPEQLVKVKKGIFTTMALAGTQIYNNSIDISWQEKERQEQKFVTDYIVTTLDQKLEIEKVKTIRAGNLVHLCTIISGKIAANFSLQELLQKLHPTPAVCGLPKVAAKAFILENENYKREFYTGFLGELHVNDTSNLFVNLRCMQIFNKKIAIYIGGGITIDSNLEKEWDETVAKSMVMLKVLG